MQNETNTAVASPAPPAPRREIRVVENEIAVLDTATFEHMFRIAEAMAAASLIPEHLRGVKKAGNFTPFTPQEVRANCFLIVNQSIRWNMDPFAVMPETYVVGGKLAYQGKLIAAVINARAGLAERLAYKFSGTPGNNDFTITVTGRFKGEEAFREINLSVGQARTDNQMWTKDPEQKLVYSGVTKWARRYAPEIVLGITLEGEFDELPDDSEPRNVTPPTSPYAEPGEAAPVIEPVKEKPKAQQRKPKATPPAQEEPKAATPAAETPAVQESPVEVLPPEEQERAQALEQMENWLAEEMPRWKLSDFEAACRHLGAFKPPVIGFKDMPAERVKMAAANMKEAIDMALGKGFPNPEDAAPKPDGLFPD